MKKWAKQGTTIINYDASRKEREKHGTSNNYVIYWNVIVNNDPDLDTIIPP